MSYFTDEQIALHHGDSLAVLRTLPDASVDCCVTSPPYFGLRDYGTEGQYGLESSPAEYVETMRALFAEVRRVLADDGTLWLNIGDSYSSTQGAPSKWRAGEYLTAGKGKVAPARNRNGTAGDVPPKNLLGIPWRTAFALQDDDSADIYELRADAPESVRRALYLETCRIRTPRSESDTPANTRSGGEQPTPSVTPSDGQPGTKPIETSSAPTAASTTSSTEKKRSSEPSGETRDATDACDSQHSSTTAANSPSVPAAKSGASTSLPSITSKVAAESTEQNCEASASTSGSTCDERTTPQGSESSATTATRRSATTASARTRKNEPPRIRRADIPDADLAHFRLVKQDRWILRNDVIWAKPNAMPESVTDRLSTRHEHLFMLAKSRTYWFDLDPIREPVVKGNAGSEFHTGKTGEHQLGRASKVSRRDSFARGTKEVLAPGQNAVQHREDRPDVVAGTPLGRNPGDVWNVPTQPFSAAHFAVMPQALAERAILAGCKPGGTVLDPFSGSGTTGLAANKHGRKYVGIDLNADYLDLSLRTRFAEPGFDFSEGIA